MESLQVNSSEENKLWCKCWRWTLNLFALGMDPSMGLERRTPVTPSSSSRYHRRRSSGSRDERYRSGRTSSTRHTSSLRTSAPPLHALPKVLCVNSCTRLWNKRFRFHRFHISSGRSRSTSSWCESLAVCFRSVNAALTIEGQRSSSAREVQRLRPRSIWTIRQFYDFDSLQSFFGDKILFFFT